MDGVHIGERSIVRRAIIDKFVQVPPGATVGVDRELDLARGYTVTASGLTVLSKGQTVRAD